MRLTVKNRSAPLVFNGVGAEVVELQPGENELDEDQLAILADHDEVLAWYVDQGIIVPPQPDPDPIEEQPNLERVRPEPESETAGDDEVPPQPEPEPKPKPEAEVADEAAALEAAADEAAEIQALDGLHWQTAKGMVEAETSLAVLEAWAAAEDRPSVLEAIEKRCAELKE